jgi:hypothetical protein
VDAAQDMLVGKLLSMVSAGLGFLRAVGGSGGEAETIVARVRGRLAAKPVALAMAVFDRRKMRFSGDVDRLGAESVSPSLSLGVSFGGVSPQENEDIGSPSHAARSSESTSE